MVKSKNTLSLDRVIALEGLNMPLKTVTNDNHQMVRISREFSPDNIRKCEQILKVQYQLDKAVDIKNFKTL